MRFRRICAVLGNCGTLAEAHEWLLKGSSSVARDLQPASTLDRSISRACWRCLCAGDHVGQPRPRTGQGTRVANRRVSIPQRRETGCAAIRIGGVIDEVPPGGKVYYVKIDPLDLHCLTCRSFFGTCARFRHAKPDAAAAACRPLLAKNPGRRIVRAKSYPIAWRGQVDRHLKQRLSCRRDRASDHRPGLASHACLAQ